MMGYLYKKIRRHNPVVTSWVLTVIIINMEVAIIKGRDLSFLRKLNRWSTKFLAEVFFLSWFVEGVEWMTPLLSFFAALP